jgi:hypothetical protein
MKLGRLLIALALMAAMFGVTNAPAQDLQRFCKDLEGALSAVKISHPEWPYAGPKQVNECWITIEKDHWTDATRLLQVIATVSKTTDGAGEYVEEYRTRMEQVASDRKRLKLKLFDDRTKILDLAPKSTGWQSLYRWDYAPNQSVIFGRYDKLYIQITAEEFPFVDLIQNFLITYKFNQ